MAAAIIGLVGALLGAVTALFGSVLADRRQVRLEERRWRRDRRAAAYEGSLRHLLRAANRRSEIKLTGSTMVAVLAQEHQREWFDDLIEAQYWLRILTTRCGADQAGRLIQAADDLDAAISAITNGQVGQASPRQGASLGLNLDKTIRTVTEAARLDIGDGLFAVPAVRHSPQTTLGRSEESQPAD